MDCDEGHGGKKKVRSTAGDDGERQQPAAVEWDIAAIFRAATGYLRLKPDEFWRLTIGEFNEMCEARREDDERMRRVEGCQKLALIQGFRAERIDRDEIELLLFGGEEEREEQKREEFAELIAISRERARMAAEKAGR